MRARTWFFVCVLGIAACSPDAATTLKTVYERAAMHHLPDRNPVVVVPGIMGSRLVDPESGQLVWGAFARGGVRPTSAESARLVALPIDSSRGVGALSDELVADKVLDRLSITFAGLPFELQAYAEILRTLGAGGYRDAMLADETAIDYGREHFTCFQFPYDWRQDNVVNAGRLARFIEEKRAYVKSEYARRFGISDYPVKFDLVAHSMGGLIARYYLQYGAQPLEPDGDLPRLTWEGARHVERVVLIGTPNAGTVTALDNLVNGRDFGRPLLPYYPAALLGTFPSMYQLLPRARHRALVRSGANSPTSDLFDVAFWDARGWGLLERSQATHLSQLLPDVKTPSERRALAREHLRTLLAHAERFQQALDRPAPLPAGLRLYIVVGDGQRTLRTMSVDLRSGRLRPLDFAPGDGTVLRESVLLDERMGGRWRPYVQTPLEATAWLVLPDDHLELTRSVTFRDNVLFWLLEEPRMLSRDVVDYAPASVP